MIKSLIVSIFLLMTIGVLGQKYSFVTYSTEQGLPQSQVSAINQDSKGFLWIGTLGGLAKFNGNKFTTYSAIDGLLNNRIRSISVFDNTLWIGHDGGVSFIKNDSIRSIEFSGNGNDRSRDVSKILKFKDRIYVCSNGGGLFVLENNQLKKIQQNNIDYDKVREAAVYNGQLYLATRGGMLISSDGERFTRMSAFGEDSFSGVCVKNNRMVLTTFSKGIYIKNLESKKLIHIDASEIVHSVYGCYIDNNDLIWLVTLNGIVQVNIRNELTFLDDSNGLPLNMLGCFFNDSDGNLWIGSQGKGLFRYPGTDFTYYDKSTGFPSDLFITGFQDKKGDYYFGTYDKGVLRKESTGIISSFDIEESTIWASLDNVDGSKWFGSGSSLIQIDERNRITYHTMNNNPQIPGSKISALYKVSDTKMYIGGNKGVSVYENGVFKKLTNASNSEIGTVRDFEIINDELFCVTNLGLMHFIENKFELVENSDFVIYNLEKDDDNTLWFGAEEGLYYYKNNEIKQVQLLSDPASNYIAFLNIRDNKMYVGTNNGLFILTDFNSDDIKIERFGVNDGVIDLETNLNSGFFDAAGTFWFGTASGLVNFSKTNSKKILSKPKVSLVDILLNYQLFDYQKYSNSFDENGFPLSLSLPYSKNSITFEIEGVSLGHHEGVSFQFWLEGLNDTWSSLSKNTTIAFSSLPASEYTLHLRAIDIEGHTSEEIKYPFEINAAFYNTWWFYLIAIILIAGIVRTVFKIRLKRIAESNEKDKLRYKSRLLILEQQSMNASMNRHFIFNSLNSIQYFINTQDRFSANKYLTSFAKLIRKNLDSATSPGNIISLEDELERIQLYLSLESMRFNGRFDYEINVKEVDVESEFIPAMIMQPFIENSIIHGILPNEKKKGLIKISIAIRNDYLEILIEDNGIGIKNSIAQKTKLAGDHKSQGMEITSKRIELLQKITNNDISLVGPYEIIEDDGLVNGTGVLIKIPCENLVNSG